jgi:hypothetical protein
MAEATRALRPPSFVLTVSMLIHHESSADVRKTLTAETSSDESNRIIMNVNTREFGAKKFWIYTESSSMEDAEELYNKAKLFCEALGFSIEEESDWYRGSLWRNALAWLTSGVTIRAGLTSTSRPARHTSASEGDAVINGLL